VLIAQGRLGFIEGSAACVIGIFAGDLLLYVVGRLTGPAALRFPPLARKLTLAQLQQASTWIAQRGLWIVFLSRFTPGLRLPTYFTAGLTGVPFGCFAGLLLAAALVWTPILVGATVLFGSGLLRTLLGSTASGVPGFLLGLAAVWLLVRTARTLWGRDRRELWGAVRRTVRWEFWPAWAIYAPVVPYLLYNALRYRSLTLFTLANPGITGGGFTGESKSEILGHLTRVPGAVADFELIRSDISGLARLRQARLFVYRNGWPVVLKPDVGERGEGVSIVRSEGDLGTRLAQMAGPVIIQRYVPGVEFGVFYYRYPGETQGHILSITEKRFPVVHGDGKATLGELILRDHRATCLAGTYRKLCRRPMTDVPAAGERVQLVEIGSHCRGAIFLDGRHLASAALEQAIDRVAKAHPGFYFGRFDLRAGSVQALRAGKFQVIELNGVTSEATHIYDPAVSLVEAYRVLLRQWRIAFEIGAANRREGAVPMKARELLALVFRRRLPVVPKSTEAQAGRAA
jgi:membrane protein DedA with SNARE-associated domain